jgi:REP element-mobilizing transposase RayT
MPYNPQIHHRRSLRLKGYDYSKAGLYFITICCQDKQFLFGDVKDSKMELNDAGKGADQCWIDIPKHFPDAVLHEYVIMPNHVHGIVELLDGTENGGMSIGAVNLLPKKIRAEDVLPQQENQYQKMIPRSIGAIVKGYKVCVTKWMRANTTIQDVWQRNYYEHIIRDEKAYNNIASYIINNPVKWDEDKFRR